MTRSRRAATRPGRPARPIRFALVAASVTLIGLLTVGSVSASTPVTDGYLDKSYGGGSFRPSADKTQSKLWYTDGTWFAGMFLYRTSPTPAKSEYHIYRLDRTTHSWIDTGTLIDTRDQSHGDYLWNEASKTLWVASAHDGLGGVDDSTKIYRFGYNPTTNVYTLAAGFPKTIANTVGGTRTVTITRDSTGRLWTVWPGATEVRYSVSTDLGVTWATPAQVPAQAGNPISAPATGAGGDTASVIAFGSKVGVAWSDHDALPAAANDGYYFATIDAAADPTVAGNWSLAKLPTLVPGGSPTETADNHINLKATADGRVYMVGKTGKDTAACATNKSSPLIELFQRTTAGAWSVHLVGTVGDCNTRPQVVISEELSTAFVVMTSPNGGGAVYLKSAPLTGPEALKFRAAADQSVERGVPLIRSASETAIDDPTTTKQSVTGASDIVVLANNLTNTRTNNQKYYLHNEWPIAATDTTAPTGTVVIAAGAANTTTPSVSVAVAATDAGSGVALVRLSNSATTSGGVLTTGQTFAYRTPISWSLLAGDGDRTVYAQWRDGAGHWSAVRSDAIRVDTTAPTGSVVIGGGAAATASRSVTLALTATDGPSGTGVTQALISNTADFASATTVAYAASVPWTLPAGDGTKTVHVRYRDAVGRTSSTATDTIVLDQTPPSTGTVLIAGGAGSTSTTGVTLTLAGAGGDATKARASNKSDMSGALSVPTGGSPAWTLTAGVDGIRTVYVQWADALGNWSAPVSDAIFFDTVKPTGGLAINGNAAWTNSLAASLTFPNTETDVTAVRVGTAAGLSGVAYRAYTPGMSLPWTLSAGDGTKTLYAQFRDVGGRESGVVSDTIGLDTVKPNAGGLPVHRIGGVVTTGIATRFSWTGGSDAGSGVAGYLVQRSVNGAPYATVATIPELSAVYQLASGRTYKYRVATTDRAGNLSVFRAGPRFKASNISQSSASVRYRSRWKLVESARYMSGKARVTSVRGATATLTFTGNRVAWLSRRGPTQGTARVYINGRLVARVNLNSATWKDKQIVYARSFSTVRTRTLKIVVTGSLGRRITVDQFFVLR